ncbi:MAG TPA: glycogen debranching N-terminal domain-containing protein [Polyangiaceae bacterium]|nr:glycogen debranching N-terminal domain-containing protein [Polyangiaceae bacterium]
MANEALRADALPDDGRGRETRESCGPTLALPRVGEFERLVCARGSMFLVTTQQGDIAPAGARELGLFLRDTRFLSHYELDFSSGSPVRLSAETSNPAYNQVDLMLSDAEREETLDDPTNFFHIRRRQMLDGGLIEEIVLTNFLMRTFELQIELRFGADFADIFEVRGAQRSKRGRLHDPRIEGTSVVLSYTGLCGTRYETLVSFGLVPSELTEDRAVFEMSLAPDRNAQLEVRVLPVVAATTRSRPGVSFARRADSLANEEHVFRAASTKYVCDDAGLQAVLDRAIADLYALRVQFDQHTIVGAGIPWFCAPFGRDSLITAYEALTLNPDFATDTLRTLAAFQGRKFDSVTEEEPGKIFHELRFGEMAKCGEIPHSPYYGSIDATPLFVVVADAASRFAHDRALLQELRPAIEAAIGWIDARSENGAKLVRYERGTPRGLLNQGWKDSRSGVSFPDGRRAAPPVALIEVQGYCVDAYARATGIFHALGDEEAARRCERSAGTMSEMVNRVFWMPEANRYAYAIDGADRLVPTIVSNVGHLLWSRVAPPDRATCTARTLLASSSFSGFGIRTLASEQPVYNPLSYHNGTVWPHDNALIVRGFVRYGLYDEALRVFEGLHAAMSYYRDHRLPELFCGIGKRSGPLVRYPVACSPQAWASGAPLLLIQSILGLRPDAPRGRLVVKNPRLPRTLRKLELLGLRIGSSLVDIGFRRVGARCHVDKLNVTGGPLKTEIEIE